MTSKLTKAAQQKAVGEGLAVGCLALGRTELPSGKTDVEFAFRHAWRRWAHVGSFPQVKAGPAQDDIYYQIMGRSENRQGPSLAYWEVGRTLRPQPVGEWTMDEADDSLRDSYGLPLSAWVDLARLFCDDLTRTRSEQPEGSE